jgi:hypothetical protein
MNRQQKNRFKKLERKPKLPGRYQWIRHAREQHDRKGVSSYYPIQMSLTISFFMIQLGKNYPVTTLHISQNAIISKKGAL